MESVVEAAASPSYGDCDAPGAPDRLMRKAETVLCSRTDRILLVLERCTDNQNYLACLRTAEILGVQNVWIVLSPRGMKNEALIAADGWTSGHLPPPPSACRRCWRMAGKSGPRTWRRRDAILLHGTALSLPARLAVVMGREADGVSREMLAAAHRRVCLPMYGFNDSFNLSVATSMVLHHLFLCCPEARGDLTEGRKRALRTEWYGRLARSDAQRSEFLSRVDSPPPPFSDVRRPDAHRASWVPPKIARKELEQAASLAAQRQVLREGAASEGEQLEEQ
ncbi:hypothetical protein VOLCADRAFT_116506 [Volvox carteri f. nagariensis]|uniref:tRNA/rRNA methyltransferase SpoU type domain-containing protein n=1 Tax=Volvox carteri f. nagariensis TaxID=3068 RepID=D8TMM6_VOLCA|nr:uncharacterized protein VOLCADRAFT_116506 [Volvox carteri f. nagariensis]EFJ51149.1 hypothetical protein VOLCADRAFT_116506 [Volvox carteri f. nagariensis]|eukprot:XP_002947616.1 hypothetical protein VOLCADRAFT_116506 [Volvox carteri f. nagariensis]